MPLLILGGALVAGIVLGLISVAFGLFFQNIIIFDGLAFAITGGIILHTIYGLHTAFAIIAGIVIFIIFILLQRTRIGFWLIGSLISLTYGFVSAFLAYEFSNKDLIWTWVIFIFGTLVIMGLHYKAYNDIRNG